MKIYDELDLINPPKGAVIGNHGIWLPNYDGKSIKVPFQWGGKVTKYSKRETCYPRDSLSDEIAILRALAELQMAPPIGDAVFFRNVISNYPGAWHCDPCGAYGYEFADATKLPPGKFSLDVMRQLPIEGSSGAWGDVAKPENIVNGYLVDVRRSGQDLLHWQGDRPWPFLGSAEYSVDLRARVHRDCQFPPGERSEAYQDFWLDGELERGQRRVVERAHALGFYPERGANVLDIGCQSGSFLQYAEQRAGVGRFVGVEMSPAYVDCARALARSCGQNICIRQMDVVKEHGTFLSWIKDYFPRGIDHLLLLSMEKHLGEKFMFDLIDELRAEVTYIETNAVAKDDGTGPEPNAPMKLWAEVKARGGQHVGNSRDRNLRRLYRIAR